MGRNRVYPPLDDLGRKIVEENVGVAMSVSKRLRYMTRRGAEEGEIESAAFHALCLCVARDRGKGITEPGQWFFNNVKLETMNQLRMLVGCKHRPKFRATVYLDGEREDSTFLDSGEMPVGWELESEDEVRAAAVGLPPRQRDTILGLFLEAASGGDQKALGKMRGVSRAAIANSLKMVRDKFGAAA